MSGGGEVVAPDLPKQDMQSPTTSNKTTLPLAEVFCREK